MPVFFIADRTSFSLVRESGTLLLNSHPVHTFLRMRVANDESAQQVAVRQSRGQPVHIAVRCDGCGLQSIVGPRWHCASCVGGADFVSPR